MLAEAIVVHTSRERRAIVFRESDRCAYIKITSRERRAIVFRESDRCAYVKITSRERRAIVFAEAIVVHTFKLLQESVERSCLQKRSLCIRSNYFKRA